MHRKTDLSLTQIVAALDNAPDCPGPNPMRAYPAGMLANEIGNILWSGSDESADAERELVSLLSSKKDGLRFIAWNYLRHSPRTIADDTKKALDAFERDTKNEHIVSAH